MPITAKTYTTEVICLRTIDFGEADKILHLYAPDYGRISAIAKGVKKSKSKLAGACELLNLSEVQLSKGKNLDVLCQYQPRETFIGIRTNLLKLAYAQLFAELVYQTGDGFDMDSHQMFGLLRNGLTTLDAVPEEDIVPVGVEFQMALLHAAGYHPQLNECIYTGETLDMSAPFYAFSGELGGITTPERKREQEIKTGLSTEWVNVSTSTLSILTSPHAARRSMAQLLKAQKFLKYYYHRVFEKKAHSYDLLFNLLETEVRLPEAEVQSL